MPDDAIPDKPPLECPDCDGVMRLQRKPAHWDGGGGPWVYLCENRPNGCRGLMSAHPNGEPEGVPAPQEIRTARRHCHSMFDRLWIGALAMPCYQGAERDPKRRAVVLGAARHRAYRFLADRLGISVDACHISMMTDIEQLRRFYKIARDATPEQIRDWAKANPLPPKEKKRKKEENAECSTS